MKRFLTTTAIVLAMTGAANAQTEPKAFGYVEMQQGDFYASDLIGMRIYNSESQVNADTPVADGAEAAWDDIGEINDIIVTKDGNVSAVILGVGGFLGVGERDVAVPMDEITALRGDGDSDDRFLVVSTSKEALESTPAYDRGTDDMAAHTGAPNDNMGQATTNTDSEMTTEKSDMAESEMETDTATERPLLARPTVEREGYAEADMAAVSQLSSDELEGNTVYGADDENVGEIETLVVGDDGKVENVVINVGGFLGLGEKQVAVTFDELQILQEVDGDDYRIYIDSTEENLKAQPEYEVEQR